MSWGTIQSQVNIRLFYRENPAKPLYNPVGTRLATVLFLRIETKEMIFLLFAISTYDVELMLEIMIQVSKLSQVHSLKS